MGSSDRDRRPRTAPDTRGTPRSARSSQQGSQRQSPREQRYARGSQASIASLESDRSSRISQGSRQYRGSKSDFDRTAISRSEYDKSSAGRGQYDPMHRNSRDINQYSLNSPAHGGGRLPSGKLLSGFSRNDMVHSPRAGHSRTQFGGFWEDHKTEHRPWPPQSATKTGLSDFDANEALETTTYSQHFGTTFDGYDTMGSSKPNVTGVSTAIRSVNGFGRNPNGGFYLREQMGEPKSYNHGESFRAMPSFARGKPEPTRPGPGFTRNDLGGYFRT